VVGLNCFVVPRTYTSLEQDAAAASVKALKAELKRYAAAHNQYSPKPFRWTKSADAIIKSVERAKHALPN